MFLPSHWLKSLWLQIPVEPRKKLHPRGERFFRLNVEELEGRNPPSAFLAGPGTINSYDGSLDLSATESAPGHTRTFGAAGLHAGLENTHGRAKWDHGGTGATLLSDVDVGVTVGDSNRGNFNVLTGPVLDGAYAVRCNGVGGNNQWLAPDGTSGVKLNTTSSTWIFTQVENPAGNCHTIQCEIDGTTYYLQWANSGNDATTVGLVTEAGNGTTWQLDGEHIKAFSDQPAQPNCPYMNGDVSNGTINMVQSSVETWSLGTY